MTSMAAWFVHNMRLDRRDRHDRALRIFAVSDPRDGFNDSLFFAPVSQEIVRSDADG